MGNFSSSDDLTFVSADYGAVLHRRLTLDYDGNIRLYSWEEEGQSWVVSWQAIQKPCEMIPGACGANSLCSYVIGSGRKCSCPPGYKMKNRIDWADGCELEVDLSCEQNESGFLQLSQVDFYSYYRNDFGMFNNYNFDQCRDLCLAACDCKAFEYSFNEYYGYSKCSPNTIAKWVSYTEFKWRHLFETTEKQNLVPRQSSRRIQFKLHRRWYNTKW